MTELCGRVAVMKGPVVYCAEEADQKDCQIRDIRIEKEIKFQESEEAIGGILVPVLEGTGTVRSSTEALYSKAELEEQAVRIRLIPYHAWANRGVGAIPLKSVTKGSDSKSCHKF